MGALSRGAVKPRGGAGSEPPGLQQTWAAEAVLRVKPPTHSFPWAPAIVGGMVLGHAEPPHALQAILPPRSWALNAGAPPIMASPTYPTNPVLGQTARGAAPSQETPLKWSEKVSELQLERSPILVWKSVPRSWDNAVSCREMTRYKRPQWLSVRRDTGSEQSPPCAGAL